MNLRERFCRLWGDGGDSLYAELKANYEHSSRMYHTLRYHITEMLRLFDRHKKQAFHVEAVELAIFFHDVFPSEQESADFARAHMQRAGKDAADLVYNLILITVPTRVPETQDEKLIVDIDRSSLALPRDEFRHNTKLLEEESGLSPGAFAKQTTTFFEMLLSQDHLFFTEEFLPLEQRARANMQAYLNDQLS